ncbi:MAG: hypothetical protein JSV67_01265 [Thermoplasmatales archaeon]|nr:MAG: hypothetical protein JSV67_01265 [Thermoplasmatales archaeon]
MKKKKDETEYQPIEQPDQIKLIEPTSEIKPKIEEKIEEILQIERQEQEILEVTNEKIPIKNSEIEEEKNKMI